MPDIHGDFKKCQISLSPLHRDTDSWNTGLRNSDSPVYLKWKCHI